MEEAKNNVFPLGAGSYVLRTEKQKAEDFQNMKVRLKEEHHCYDYLIKPLYIGSIAPSRLVRGVEIPFAFKDGLRSCPDTRIILPFEYPDVIDMAEVKVAPFDLDSQEVWEEFSVAD